MDYTAPLRWEHEDGRSGVEVRAVPLGGRVFFYDAAGPLARVDDVAECRWWVLIKIDPGSERQEQYRVTRIIDRDGGKHYLLPGHVGVIDCDETHPCKGAHPCVVVDAMCNELFCGAAVAG